MSSVQNNQGAVPDPTAAPTPSQAEQMMQGALAPGFQLLALIMQQQQAIQGVDGAPPKGHGTVEQAQDNSAMLTVATKGIIGSDPQLQTPDQATLDQAIENVALAIVNGEDPFGGLVPNERVLLAINIGLGKPPDPNDPSNPQGGGTSGANATTGTEATRALDGTGGANNDPGKKVEALAALGGLIMVALFVSNAQFSKEQSLVELDATKANITEQGIGMAIARGEMSAAQHEADIAVFADLGTMIGKIAGTSIEGIGSFKGIKNVEGGMDSGLAQMHASLWNAAGNIESTAAEKGFDILKTAETVQYENMKTLLQAIAQIVQQAEQSMAKLADDSHALVDKTQDLIRQMLGAIMQALNKLGTG